MKKLSLDELIAKMEWHTAREVSAWKTDLESDKKELREIDKTKAHIFIWVTRENGTFLINLFDDTGTEFLEAVRRTFSKGYKSYNEYRITRSRDQFTFKKVR